MGDYAHFHSRINVWEAVWGRFAVNADTEWRARFRQSDLDILQHANFDNPEDPTKFTFISKKTNDGLTIFLVPEEKELYMKYLDIPTSGLAFPKKCNQKMNTSIKEIAKMLGFTREVEVMQYCGKKPVYKTAPLCDVIGTHAARRTFVVHALEQGMSPEMAIAVCDNRQK